MVYANSIKRAIREGVNIYLDRRDAGHASCLLHGTEIDAPAADVCSERNPEE